MTSGVLKGAVVVPVLGSLFVDSLSAATKLTIQLVVTDVYRFQTNCLSISLLHSVPVDLSIYNVGHRCYR